MSAENVEVMARKVLEMLPQLLRERPDLAFKLYEELREHFVPKDYFEKFLQKFDEMLREMREMRKEYNERFAKIDERLEEMRREYNERFARIDERLEEMRREYNERFEEMRREYNERFLRVENQIAELSRRISELSVEVKNLRVQVGALGRRLGRNLEVLILETYSDALSRFGVKISEIRRLRVTDPDGKILPVGAELEIDIFVTDEKKVLMEVKSFVERDDTKWFFVKCKRIEELLGMRAEKVIIAVEATDKAQEFCRDNNITLISRNIVKEDEY